MAQQTVNVGAAANDGTGDPLRTAYTKLNANDAELYAAVAARIPTTYLDTDGTLAANSDSKIASQKAVVTYVAARIAALDVLTYKGVIDCSANPNYPSANAGDTYRISVAGKIGGGSGPNVEIGDLLLCITDGAASGTHASVGANWDIIQTNIDGAVVGPASATSGNIAVFSGPSGKVISDSLAIGSLLSLSGGTLNISASFATISSGSVVYRNTNGDNAFVLGTTSNAFRNTAHIFQSLDTLTTFLTAAAGSTGIRFNGYGAGTLSTNASGVISASSDERLKHVVGAFDRGLADLKKMDRPIIYNLFSEMEGKLHVCGPQCFPETGEAIVCDKVGTWDETGYAYDYAGWTAQGVSKGIPEAVGEGPDGMKTLDMRAIVAAQHNAILQLEERIADLESRRAAP